MPWRPIDDSTPRDKPIWLYWPRYVNVAYLGCDDVIDCVAVGQWRHNQRLATHYGNGHRTPNADDIESNGYREWYFSDMPDRNDDYSLALPANAPTHWRPHHVPKPPTKRAT